MPRTGRPRSFDDDQVIAGALELFWRRGYAATSLRDLKDELGVLPGSLYAAYGDKHGLFLRALERYVDAAREQATGLSGDDAALPRIRALLLSVLQAAQETPGRGCMLGNTAAELLPEDETAGRLVNAGFGALESGLEQTLRAAQRSGEVRPDIDCGAQARLLLALMQGLHVVARTEPDPDRLTDAIDAALAPLTHHPESD
ncbi:TetR family transcriptional regulator [Actinomadura pelletieri DSM 43383]|uniref:TetR family transcriptional regulator n=1 Tax=Actinomadura pelletieri DSM 43383 TaxID=1120940 RepID=A0A495QU33_9ACTN|nr:TetR/AcrR family transcriptional regulator [Actinomadura pelletieri]RKS76913.1 TetR family transcriptional regulator [Actinomadura pelletieri DSM 43383]